MRSLEFKDILLIGLISLTLLLLVDFFLGKNFVPPTLIISHEVFHHSLSPNMDTQHRWGKSSYRVCTDGNGFKSSCNSETRMKFDIGVIGDSFIEGVGRPYEETLVGLIAESNRDLAIAN
ncbi:uncharacterized protein METZ01_LOCUS455149, partial [marine metagenome]